MDEVKLMQCPACGPDGHAELHGGIATGGRYVRCEICGFQGPANNSQSKAIAAWNQRADAQGEEVAHAVPIPGSNGGFTMAAFKASDVPEGSPLYTHPAPPADMVELVEALKAELAWHEGEIKALSKQPPTPALEWPKHQHRERIEALSVALAKHGGA